MTKTFVVKDAEFRDGGGRGMASGGKVNSTCCRVHKNAELVPDNTGMHVRVHYQAGAGEEGDNIETVCTELRNMFSHFKALRTTKSHFRYFDFCGNVLDA
jgi:hypothetical protein